MVWKKTDGGQVSHISRGLLDSLLHLDDGNWAKREAGGPHAVQAL